MMAATACGKASRNAGHRDFFGIAIVMSSLKFSRKKLAPGDLDFASAGPAYSRHGTAVVDPPVRTTIARLREKKAPKLSLAASPFERVVLRLVQSAAGDRGCDAAADRPAHSTRKRTPA